VHYIPITNKKTHTHEFMEQTALMEAQTTLFTEEEIEGLKTIVRCVNEVNRPALLTLYNLPQTDDAGLCRACNEDPCMCGID
jgi:hypothetical protein